MSINRGLLALAASAGGLAGPALAAPWVVNGTVTAHAGVDSNPFLTSPSQGATGTGGIGVNVRAQQDTERGTTSLLGSADYSGYVSKYGTNRNFFGSVQRTQRLTEHLNVSAQASYTNTLSPQANFGFDPTLPTASLDYLTIGTRTERIDGAVNLDWQANARDSFRIGAFGNRSKYGSRVASDNDQYGGNASFLHRIDARTQVGVQLFASKIDSDQFQSSSTRQALLQVIRQINPIWTFDGSFGLVQQRTSTTVLPGVVSQGRHLTYAFNGSLCGTYPRTNICFTFARQAAPSGIGGLRTDTTFGVGATHSITEHSRVTLSGAFDNSTSNDNLLIPRQRFYTATLGYSRDISRRIAVGGTAKFQRRDTEGSGLFQGSKPSEYGLSATISYAFGRIGQ